MVERVVEVEAPRDSQSSFQNLRVLDHGETEAANMTPVRNRPQRLRQQVSSDLLAAPLEKECVIPVKPLRQEADRDPLMLAQIPHAFGPPNF